MWWVCICKLSLYFVTEHATIGYVPLEFRHDDLSYRRKQLVYLQFRKIKCCREGPQGSLSVFD
jgi:hypothetical protein